MNRNPLHSCQVFYLVIDIRHAFPWISVKESHLLDSSSPRPLLGYLSRLLLLSQWPRASFVHNIFIALPMCYIIVYALNICVHFLGVERYKFSVFWFVHVYHCMCATACYEIWTTILCFVFAELGIYFVSAKIGTKGMFLVL